MATKIIRKALTQKRRGVSPIIAVIMLIGLTVAAGSIVYFTVLPMFEVHPKLRVDESSSFLEYRENFTKIKAEIVLRNTGKGTAEVLGITVEYRRPDDWKPISILTMDNDLPFDITPANYEIVILYFHPPTDENPTQYRFIVQYQEGKYTFSLDL